LTVEAALMMLTTAERFCPRFPSARMDDRRSLLEQPERYRRLARGIFDASDPAVKALIALAEEFEARAAALLEEASALKPEAAPEGGGA
jgi:uncharacterized tellurite resistance protein B-like protein